MELREPRANLIVLLAAVCLSGCALTNMNLQPPAHQEVTGASPVGQGREVLVVVPFADRRLTAQRCGMKKNGYKWPDDVMEIPASDLDSIPLGDPIK